MKKVLISLSSPEFVALDYTGQNGCYSACKPVPQSRSLFTKAAKLLGLPLENPDDLHCTLVYSREAAPAKENLNATEDALDGYFTHIDHWAGHDGKTYIVAGITSTSITREHARLRNAGCIHSFTPFKPHVTLYAGIDMTDELRAKIDRLNEFLAKNPKQVMFESQTFSDVKSD